MKKNLSLLIVVPCLCVAQVQNDANAPLHLMKPAYSYPYGVPKTEEVKSTMDRILDYLDKTTYMELDETGKRLKRGDYRLTSYEWGVTYSAMLRAGELTGDARYTKYAVDRMEYLAKLAPDFKKRLDKGEKIDELMRQVVDPHALDDAGAVCSAMIKADDKKLKDRIETYYDFIVNKQYRLKDGQLARMRPVANTVWLDDIFMGIPPIAWYGNWDEAMRQFNLFHDKMWVKEKNLYRHGWAPNESGYHPCFFWGRANGWALLTVTELLDAREKMNGGGLKDDAIAAQLLQNFKEHLSGLMPLQGIDGCWHQLLDRPETYLETSCTAIYCYCLAHAMNKGWIEKEPYIGQTLLAWNYVNAHVNEKGQVEGTCVGTGLAFDPAFYAYRPVNNYAAHGYGPAIWAAAEVYELVSKHCVRTNDSAVHYYPIIPKSNAPIFSVDE